MRLLVYNYYPKQRNKIVLTDSILIGIEAIFFHVDVLTVCTFTGIDTIFFHVEIIREWMVPVLLLGGTAASASVSCCCLELLGGCCCLGPVLLGGASWGVLQTWEELFGATAWSCLEAAWRCWYSPPDAWLAGWTPPVTTSPSSCCEVLLPGWAEAAGSATARSCLGSDLKSWVEAVRSAAWGLLGVAWSCAEAAGSAWSCLELLLPNLQRSLAEVGDRGGGRGGSQRWGWRWGQRWWISRVRWRWGIPIQIS